VAAAQQALCDDLQERTQPAAVGPPVAGWGLSQLRKNKRETQKKPTYVLQVPKKISIPVGQIASNWRNVVVVVVVIIQSIIHP